MMPLGIGFIAWGTLPFRLWPNLGDAIANRNRPNQNQQRRNEAFVAVEGAL
jgi:hypothetical protein